MSKYKGVFLTQDDQFSRTLVETLRHTVFEVTTYRDPAALLNEVFGGAQPLQELPDLVAVDLNPDCDKATGMDLVRSLTDRDVTSEIVVFSQDMSVDLEPIMRLGARGVRRSFQKYFDLHGNLKTLAEIGKRRRLYRSPGNGQEYSQDPSRTRRRVFLSYCGEDKRFATGLRRNLETLGVPVWYSTIDPGDPWRECIKEGIDQSTVFVALVTDNYLKSPYCMGEFMRFHERVGLRNDSDLLMLPLRVEAWGTAAGSEGKFLLTSIIEHYQYLDMSMRFVDRLTALLWQIQNKIGDEDEKLAQPGRKPKPKAAQSQLPRLDLLPPHSEKSFSKRTPKESQISNIQGQSVTSTDDDTTPPIHRRLKSKVSRGRPSLPH